jgi:hypothetical protein
MNIDVLTSVSKSYNVKKIDILKGQSFTLLTDAPDDIRWFSDQDNVLNITATGKKANIVAANTGQSQIMFIDSANGLADNFFVNVVETLEQAETLNPSGGEIVNK